MLGSSQWPLGPEGQKTVIVGNFSINKLETPIYTFGRFTLNLNLLMPPSINIYQATVSVTIQYYYNKRQSLYAINVPTLWSATPRSIDNLCTDSGSGMDSDDRHLRWMGGRVPKLGRNVLVGVGFQCPLLPMVEFPIVVDDACSRDSTSVDHSVPVAGIQILAV